ncbi:hypothetical protein B0H16DRAFT_1516575 [Mycena metata]|uniref:MYND-type domain-containing protein n=1 Tax=Mycena metata TaxID=1033252 RepID=A0AAD7NPK8_9AGAR|nr:hypothetical protein B0H16DRAFT_1516575 [Mycena metata]
MRYDISAQKPVFDDYAKRDCFTIWERWQPACDSCGRAESAREKLMSCSYCRVARYCSDKCQKHDWAAGNEHKKVCHLFEVDKKLSDVFVRSDKFKPAVHDPKLDLSKKKHVSRRARLHHHSMQWIKHAVFKDNPDLKKTMHLGIFVKLVGKGPDYDERSFIIDKLALMPWDKETWSMLMVGYCSLPDGTTSDCTNNALYRTVDPQEAPLPPGFDLQRFITHVNRGITHFHGSFWPFPRRLSDAAFADAQPPKDWVSYMKMNYDGFVFVGPDRMGFGVEKRDGTRTPLYRYYSRSIRLRPPNATAAPTREEQEG